MPILATEATSLFGSGGVIQSLVTETFNVLSKITENNTLMIFIGVTLTGACVGLVRRLIKGARA